MKRIRRFVALFTPVAFLLAPLFASAQAVTYPSCTDAYSTCHTNGEVCTYVITGGGQATPSVGTCAQPNTIPNSFSYPFCMNDANCAGHPGEICNRDIGSGSRIRNCVVPPPPSSQPPPAPPPAPPAYSGINAYYLQGYASSIINIINGLVAPVLLAIAFIFFLFGVYRYFILGATNETSREEGRKFVLWSIIGFVVIFSLWGLVAAVGSTFGLTAGGSAPPYPTL